CAAIAVSASTACITAPPPDLPPQGAHRPTIQQESVQPPPSQILTALPSEFVVPVVLIDPDQSFEWEVFVDYDPIAAPNPIILQPVSPSPDTVDGGVALVSFNVSSQQADASRCHVIEFLVAHAFNPSTPHTWDSLGGDLVTWIYNPGGGPGGCPV